MAPANGNVEEMLRFQMSLLRLLTPREPGGREPKSEPGHPVEAQMEALVRKASRRLPE